MADCRTALPQLSDSMFLTDGGLETTLIFHEGLDLPEFAAFVLLDDEAGREALRSYYRRYAAIARDAGCGFVLEAPTWRANPDWAAKLGYSPERLDAANRAAIDLMVELRGEFETLDAPVVISGCVGPRSDGYRPAELMSPAEAQRYHGTQIATFADAEADLVTAITMTHSAEAIGVSRAATEHGLPVVISFTVETDGSLPSGESLAAAVEAVDDATGAGPAYYMINCAHPTHFADTLRDGGDRVSRVRGLRANASTMSHAELDEAEELDAGDPADLADRYAGLRADHGHLTILGGCCGTDHRHVDAIRRTCLTAAGSET
jgi:S-methylmethionine-dependent homocysteine/selenocysteine methylase